MIQRFVSGSSGFGRSTESIPSVEAVVKKLENPTLEVSRQSFSTPGGRKDQKIHDLILKASRAYIVDGLVRQAVDKYTELCRGYWLDGEPERVKYLTRRLETMSLATGEHWKITVSRLFHEYFKNGNPFFIKVRGRTPMTKRGLYWNNPRPIKSIFPISAERLDIATDDSKMPIGWNIIDAQKRPNLNSGEGVEPYRSEDTYIRLPELPERHRDMLRPGVDIVHIPYKQGADSAWGVGLTFPALDDITLLRAVEQMVASVIRKNSHPLIHYRITRASSPLSTVNAEIQQAGRMFRQAQPDGVIITGGAHEIKAIGSESQALRNEGYLIHFTKRGLAGLGVSPYLMGYEGATLGTAEAAIAQLVDRVRTCQEQFAATFEMFFLWELLYESGRFNPWENDEDRCYLRFEEIDYNRRIKEETHWTDTYNKGGIDVDELRSKLGYRKTYKAERLYLNQVQIPLAKAKAADKPSSSNTAASEADDGISTERVVVFRDMIEPYLPETVDQIEASILMLERVANIPREKLIPLVGHMESLLQDREALIQLIQQAVNGE